MELPDGHQALVQQDESQEQDTVLALDDTFQLDSRSVGVGPCMDHADVLAEVDSQAYRAAFVQVALLPFRASASGPVIDTFVFVAPYAFAFLSPRLASSAWPVGVGTASILVSFYA